MDFLHGLDKKRKAEEASFPLLKTGKRKMQTRPKPLLPVLRHVETVVSERVGEWVNVLRIGAILAPEERTVAAIVRVMGCAQEQPVQNDHRVPGRATGSSRERSRRVLVVLVGLLVPSKQPLILGIDETIERRRGRQMAARGVSRDPGRSSQKFVVNTHGLRGISLMLLTPIPWAKRVGALPFVTLLAPSERSPEERKRRHHTPTDGAWQIILPVRRWLPGRQVVIVADGTSAVLAFLGQLSRLAQVSIMTRLRLDACLSDPAPEPKAGRSGRKALPGKRQPKLADRLLDPPTGWQRQTVAWSGATTRLREFATGTALWEQSPIPPVAIRWVLIRDPQGPYEPLALLCTDQQAEALLMVAWLVLRWTVDVPFPEVRAPLGVETRAPLVGSGHPAPHSHRCPALFSLVTVGAQQMWEGHPFAVRHAVWDPKALPTFSETLADLRPHLWPSCVSGSSSTHDTIHIPHVLFHRLVETLAFAA